MEVAYVFPFYESSLIIQHSMGRKAVYGEIQFSCLGFFFKSYRVSSAMGALKVETHGQH